MIASREVVRQHLEDLGLQAEMDADGDLVFRVPQASSDYLPGVYALVWNRLWDGVVLLSYRLVLGEEATTGAAARCVNTISHRLPVVKVWVDPERQALVAAVEAFASGGGERLEVERWLRAIGSAVGAFLEAFDAEFAEPRAEDLGCGGCGRGGPSPDDCASPPRRVGPEERAGLVLCAYLERARGGLVVA